LGELTESDTRLLFGVTMRTWRRWLSPTGTNPRPDAALRLQAVALALGQLGRSHTAAGALEWFQRPHPQLGGWRPGDLLADASTRARLLEMAATSRATQDR